MILLVEQLLNGLQYGVTLFLLAAGLTLIFGIMGVINLAHGALYMVGAFAGAWVSIQSGSFWAGLLAGLAASAIAGVLVELGGDAPPLCPRPSGSGPCHLCADPDLQPVHRADLWPPAAVHVAAAGLFRIGRASARSALSDLPAVRDRRGPRRGAWPLSADQQDAGGDAGAGRGQQPPDGAGARRGYPVPLHRRLRAGRALGRACGRTWPRRSSRCRSAWATTSSSRPSSSW
jgi:hypothetical protein